MLLYPIPYAKYNFISRGSNEQIAFIGQNHKKKMHLTVSHLNTQQWTIEAADKFSHMSLSNEILCDVHTCVKQCLEGKHFTTFLLQNNLANISNALRYFLPFCSPDQK